MKEGDDEYVYDKSVSANTNTSLLSKIIGHICIGPFRLIGRVSSNICLLSYIEMLRLLKIAILFNSILFLFSLFFYFGRENFSFLLGIAVSLLCFLFLLLIVKRLKSRNTNEYIESSLHIDVEDIEQRCNEVPEKLDTIIHRNNF